jgi:hypothetical protein
VIDVRDQDTYNKNDPFQFSAENATTQPINLDKSTRNHKALMNQNDDKEISNLAMKPDEI